MDLHDENATTDFLTVEVLGPARIAVAGTTIGGLSRKNTALLAYLCARPDLSAARETLCGLLWPDSADEQSRASLRQALSTIRKRLGHAGTALVTEGDAVRIDAARSGIDVPGFIRATDSGKRADLEGVPDLYRGDLLEGFAPISPEFDRWLDAERGALRSRLVSALLRLSDSYGQENRFEDMIATSSRLIAIDPLQEHVHRRLMRAYRAQGRHDAALRQFEILKDTLSRQLGVEPERPTLDLVRDIRQDRVKGDQRTEAVAPRHHAQPRPATAPSRPSIAVLPFRGLPEGSEAALLGEGIAEDVTIDISRVPDLMVVSRQASLHLNEDRLSPRDVGDKLGVRYFLSGTVRIFGRQLRVTAHLVNCETGHEVWAERFDRELQDYFAIQSEIARTVATTAADRIEASLAQHSLSTRTEDLESYQLVLKGIGEIHRFSAESYEAAIALFTEATLRTPDYGRALGWLALAKLYLRWNIDARMDFSDIVPVAERAVALDPGESKGHCALAMCNFIHRRFDRAEFSFQSALRANPNDDLVLTEYGRYLMYVDQPEAGLQRIREAKRINPFHPFWYWSIQGRVLHTLERYEEAVQAFEKVQNPPFYVYAYLAGCHAKLGDAVKMEQARADLYRMRPDFDLDAFKAIFPYRTADATERLFESLERAGLR